MSICDACIAPGACCKDLSLYGGRKSDPGQETPEITTWEDGGIEEIEALLVSLNLPFTPEHVNGRWQTAEGRAYVSWKYSCPNLEPSGRCGAYENRPGLCKAYEPRSSPLCVHFFGDAGDPSATSAEMIFPQRTAEVFVDDSEGGWGIYVTRKREADDIVMGLIRGERTEVIATPDAREGA